MRAFGQDSLYEALPVAIVSPYQYNGAAEWKVGEVQFDGTLSHHTHPDRELVSYDWDFGDGETAADAGPIPVHTYVCQGEYPVTLTVTDDDEPPKSDSDTLLLAVEDPDSGVGPIDAPADPVAINDQPIIASAEFYDAYLDPDSTHTAVWDWGDSTTTILEDVDSSVAAQHTYAEPGVYEITLTVTDGNCPVGASTYQYVVVYDPEGGFVTGGGWIDSPEGAYTPDPSLAGKATFGFVSKYKKGAEIPTGQTEFQFHVAGMNFHSDTYQWLVVTKFKAQYKGTGTINGEGNYGFMLTAIDAKLTPSTDVDLFRIKIWDKDAGDTIIYDNQQGAPDGDDPTTAISGGSIVIHKAK